MNKDIKYIDLLIISDQYIEEDLLEGLEYMILPDIEFISPFKGSYKDQIIEFDKLITTDKLLKNAMREDGYLITNESFETSFDGYFAIGNAVKSNKSFSEQLEIVLDYIKGN